MCLLQVTCGHKARGPDVEIQIVCRDGTGRPGSTVGVVDSAILYWNVFVEIIKEPYISAAAPQGLLLPADLHTGRRVMKQASLEIHHCGEPRRFSPSLPPVSVLVH